MKMFARTIGILPIRNVTEKIFVVNKLHIGTPTRCDAQLQHCLIQDEELYHIIEDT